MAVGSALLLRRRDHRRRVDGCAVRGLHPVRRHDPDPGRDAGGGRHRRRGALAAIPRHRASGPQAALPDPLRAEHPVGSARLHPDLRAPGGRRHLARHQPPRRVDLPDGDRSEPVRHRCRGGLADGGARSAAHDRLPAPDVSHGGAVTSRRRHLALNAAGFATFLVVIFPVYWMVVTSFRSPTDIRSTDASVVPLSGTLDNYRSVFERDYFFTAVRNSLLVTGGTVVLALLVA